MDGKDAKLEVRGLKYFHKLLPLFSRLHEVGTARDTASNRRLHFDQYASLVMLYLFNPLIKSLRTLQHTLSLPKVARTIGIKRFSLGSFSEAPAVFEPQPLKAVIAELATQVQPLAKDPRLKDLQHALTLVDGTLLQALPKLAQAAAEGTCYTTARDGSKRYAWRLHTQLDLSLPQPLRIDVTGGSSSGDNSERSVLWRSLEAGRCYVADAAYADYGLFGAIAAIGSSYVCRIREDSVFEVLEERELSHEALAAGVVRDVLARPGTKGGDPVRFIELQVTPRVLKTRKREQYHKSTRSSDRLLIATNLLSLPVELVALIYSKRYSVELFFRFFKGMLGMRHLLSQRVEGVEIQTYCAVIACLLISLETGKKPNKRMVEMLGFYLMGLASEQDVIDFLNKPDNTGVKLRAKDELWKKLGV